MIEVGVIGRAGVGSHRERHYFGAGNTVDGAADRCGPGLPIALGREAAIAEAVRAVKTLGLAAINLDARFYATPLRADDERLMPLYEACLMLGVPAFVISGRTTPEAFNDPLAIDIVPKIDAMIGVTFRQENAFVSPDMYLWALGGRRYLEAASGFLRDQLVFGSSYSFRPMQQSVEELRSMKLGEDVTAKVFGGNAARLLGRIHPQ